MTVGVACKGWNANNQVAGMTTTIVMSGMYDLVDYGSMGLTTER